MDIIVDDESQWYVEIYKTKVYLNIESWNSKKKFNFVKHGFRSRNESEEKPAKLTLFMYRKENEGKRLPVQRVHLNHLVKTSSDVLKN